MLSSTITHSTLHSISLLTTLLAVVVPAYMAWSRSKTIGVSNSQFLILLAALVVGMIWGGKLAVTNKGMSVLGMLPGGMIAISFVSFLLYRNLQILKSFSIPFLLGIGIQRISCLIEGCCAASFPIPVQGIESLMCFIAAGILLKSEFRFKSATGFLLITLSAYLLIRLVTEFIRNPIQGSIPVNPLQWILFYSLILLSIIITGLEYLARNTQESKYRSHALIGQIPLGLSILLISLASFSWFGKTEKVLCVLFVILPLLIQILYQIRKQFLPALSPVSVSMICLLPFLMSQTPNENYKKNNYSALHFSGLTGQLERQVDFDAIPVWSDGGWSPCGYVTPGYYPKDEKTALIKETYSSFSGGYSHKRFDERMRSIEFEIHAVAGKNIENSQNSDYRKEQWLYALNPRISLTTKYFAIGAGVSFGTINYNNEKDNMIYEKTPFYNPSNFEGQFNIRYFSERLVCLEFDYNTVNKSMGENIATLSLGSRFNTKDRWFTHLGAYLAEDDGFKETGIISRTSFPLYQNKLYGEIFGFIHENGIKQIGFRAHYRFY